MCRTSVRTNYWNLRFEASGLACRVDGIKHHLFGQKLWQHDRGAWTMGAHHHIERHAGALEFAQHLGYNWVVQGPVTFQSLDVGGFELVAYRLAAQHRFLVELAGLAPFGGEIQKKDFAVLLC